MCFKRQCLALFAMTDRHRSSCTKSNMMRIATHSRMSRLFIVTSARRRHVEPGSKIRFAISPCLAPFVQIRGMHAIPHLAKTVHRHITFSWPYQCTNFRFPRDAPDVRSTINLIDLIVTNLCNTHKHEDSYIFYRSLYVFSYRDCQQKKL